MMTPTLMTGLKDLDAKYLHQAPNRDGLEPVGAQSHGGRMKLTGQRRKVETMNLQKVDNRALLLRKLGVLLMDVQKDLVEDRT